MNENLKVNAKTSPLEWKRKHNKLVDGVPDLLEGKDISVKNINATGKITGGEIVENMSGYSFTSVPKENYELTPIYVGVVKNGNKLTIVQFMKIKRIGEHTGVDFISFGYITIPSSVGSKIVPYVLSGQNTIDTQRLSLFSGTATPPVSKNAIMNKNSDTSLVSYMYDVSQLVLNTEYIVRFETTILLSENLTGE